MEGRQVGPLRAGELLGDFFHPFLLHALAQHWVAFARRRSRHHLRTLQLPTDVSGTVQGFARDWGGREEVVNAIIKSQGVLISPASSAPPAGLVFGIGAGAKQDLVSVRVRGADQPFVENPAGYRLLRTE